MLLLSYCCCPGAPAKVWGGGGRDIEDGVGILSVLISAILKDLKSSSKCCKDRSEAESRVLIAAQVGAGLPRGWRA